VAFAITPAGKYKIIYSFQCIGDPLYGPVTALVDVGGVLYGTASSGGPADEGGVYSLTVDGVERTIYAFKGGANGSEPNGDMIDVDGALFGTTQVGGNLNCVEGPAGCGTVFKLKPP
jgi:uncharacterized repeat protein (TIGR03803 family)